MTNLKQRIYPSSGINPKVEKVYWSEMAASNKTNVQEYLR